MQKITFLFGAGASMEVMPLANDMADHMEAITRSIEGMFLLHHEDTAVKHALQKEFCEELKAFAKEASMHKTVDTFAKKLFVSERENDFRKLKCILSAYLNLAQISSGKCDSRYDSLWAALIQNKFNLLPNNIRVLTWNYDFQIELSYQEYLPKHLKDISNSKAYLNVVTNNFDTNKLISKDQFAVYKLNGNANIYNNYAPVGSIRFEETYFFEDFSSGWNGDNVTTIINQYNKLKNSPRLQPTLSFAWEHLIETSHKGTSFIRVIEEDITDTEIIVIIGYSFPFFNRSVDRELFKSMKGLRKIYIQNPNITSVRTSLKSIIPDLATKLQSGTLDIEEVLDYKTQFFIPHEL